MKLVQETRDIDPYINHCRSQDTSQDRFPTTDQVPIGKITSVQILAIDCQRL